MTNRIKVSKPAINIREELADLKQDTGLKGQELMRADTAQEARTAIGAGRKNMIINGGMDVAQRGTTGTCSSDAYGQYKSVDRWSLYYNGSTVAQTEVNIPDGTNSLVKAAKVTVSTTTHPRPWFGQRIEHGSKLLNNKTVSLSFWGRSNTTLDAVFEFRFQDAVTNATNVVNGWNGVQGYEFTLTSEWIKYEWTGVLVDTSVNNTRVIDLLIDAEPNNWSNNDWLEVTQVQLELGSVATEFEHRSYGEELALCQRYYYRISGGDYSWITEVQRHNSTGFRSVISLPVPLRDAPEISHSGLAYWHNNGSMQTGTSSIGLGYTDTTNTVNITQLNIEWIPTYMSLTSDGNLSAMLSFANSPGWGSYLAFESEL